MHREYSVFESHYRLFQPIESFPKKYELASKVSIEIFDWKDESDVGYLVYRDTLETIGM